MVDEVDLVLGIDPGRSGGLALMNLAGQIVDVSAMPETEKDVSEYLEEFRLRIKMASIEAVHPMPQVGAVAGFQFGVNYGGLRMALIAHRIPFIAVSPQSWQKAMGCTMKGRKGPNDRNREKKNMTRTRAQELFPQLKVTHATADALLICEHARRGLRILET